jgi:signal peptidase I
MRKARRPLIWFITFATIRHGIVTRGLGARGNSALAVTVAATETTHTKTAAPSLESVPKKRAPARFRGFPWEALRSLLRALWLVVIPALLAGLTFRYLVPPVVESAGESAMNDLAKLGVEHPAELFVVLFVAFAALARYWRPYLPGGRFMSPLPLRIAARVDRAKLHDLGKAATLFDTLSKSRVKARLERLLPESQRPELASKLRGLELAVRRGNVELASKLRSELAHVARPLLRAREVWQWLAFAVGIGAAVFAAMLLRANAQPYRVLSSSMLPTLQPGQHVLGNKARNGFIFPGVPKPTSTLPKRGEVIVFRDTAEAGPENLIKRVIGLPGDEVAMGVGRPFINRWMVPNCDAGSFAFVAPGGGFVGGRVYVEFLDDRAYLTVRTPRSAQWPPYVVKPGEVFVLGDNRSGSRDSRVWQQRGASGVPLKEITALVERLLVPASRGGLLKTESMFQPLSALRLNLENVDTTGVEAGIRHCLANPPKETRPPPAGSWEKKDKAP